MKKDGVIKPYEVLWFMDHNGIIEDWFDKTFKTKKQALRYYNRHKKDKGKYGWLVTKRDWWWKPVEVYVGHVEWLGEE